MKTGLIFLSVICTANIMLAQGINEANVNTIISQVNSRAKTFCEYVVAVGTTPGQPGAVSESQKSDIIRNRVPGLFWDYYEAPRKMKTTNGPNGKVIKTRRMSDYFVSLKAQSNGSLTRARIYELRFEGIISKNKSDNDIKGFHFEKKLSDGCELWSATIRIKQVYRVINPTATSVEGKTVERFETDLKDYKVYAIIKPNGKVGVYLGDVTRAQRR